MAARKIELLTPGAGEFGVGALRLLSRGTTLEFWVAESHWKNDGGEGTLNLSMNAADSEFEEIVKAHYASLYRFALSLARSEHAAADLTQETFRRFAQKRDSVREGSKIKSWLFTTLYRQFLETARRDARFPHIEVSEVDDELPTSEPEIDGTVDATVVRAALMAIPEVYRAPLVLFYLEEHTYREIAAILDIPVGTVMSRISRGRDLLRQSLAADASPPAEWRLPQVVPGGAL